MRGAGTTVRCVGIDLAWMSDRNHSAIAAGTLRSGHLSIDAVSSGLSNLVDVLRFLDDVVSPDSDAVIAIDAPLIVENEVGMRPCEREVSRRFGRFHAGAHASNLTLYPDAGSVRLTRELKRRGFTMNVETAEAKRRPGRWFFEVYPHPAHVVLFDRERIIKYKKGRVPRRQAGLKEFAHEIREKLRAAAPTLDSTPEASNLLDADTMAMRGRTLKAHEDRIDALFCAYLAAHYWYWGDERNEMIGDITDGNIVVPTRTWDGREFA